MSGWRKWLIRAGLAVLGLILCFAAVCEIRNPDYEWVMVPADTEELFQQVPELRITEEERELMEDLLQCSGVEALLEKDEVSELKCEEDSELAAVVEAYLGPEISGTASVTVKSAGENGSHPVIFTWQNTISEMSMVQRTELDGDVEYYKCYGRVEQEGRRRVYENFDNERTQKSENRRRWFAWFRDRMWENP